MAVVKVDGKKETSAILGTEKGEVRAGLCHPGLHLKGMVYSKRTVVAVRFDIVSYGFQRYREHSGCSAKSGENS